jgi:predicted transcriptional regulator of viral defense system
MVGMKAGSVRMLLQKLAKEGVIERVGYGKYRAKQPT